MVVAVAPGGRRPELGKKTEEKTEEADKRKSRGRLCVAGQRELMYIYMYMTLLCSVEITV